LYQPQLLLVLPSQAMFSLFDHRLQGPRSRQRCPKPISAR
jgi:hypothetical protein